MKAEIPPKEWLVSPGLKKVGDYTRIALGHILDKQPANKSKFKRAIIDHYCHGALTKERAQEFIRLYQLENE